MALFDFDRVSVRIDDSIILDEVTTSIPDGGSITGVLGPSGSGKSTLLRLCNRLEVPTSGCLRFRGRDVAEEDPRSLRRRVGMVFQRPTLFPGTVRDNLLVAEPGASMDRCADVLGRVGLVAGFLDRDGGSLSGGEAQRACLARTLVTGPEVLLMDEPTSALDPAATRGLEELAASLAQEGMPILWVTHDLAQADRIADDRLYLVAGHVADDHEIAHYLAGEDSGHEHTDSGHEHTDSGHEHTEGPDAPG